MRSPMLIVDVMLSQTRRKEQAEACRVCLGLISEFHAFEHRILNATTLLPHLPVAPEPEA